MAALLPQGEGDHPRLLTHDDMMNGLAKLDLEMGKSELLGSVAPIRLVSIGGSLAVCLMQNRTASVDIDCILDPNIAAAPDYVSAFHDAVYTAGRNMFLADDWLNLQLQTFIARNRMERLFLESIEQDIKLYEGANLVIYAGRLDWALERKMRRVSHVHDRRQNKDVDVTDAAAIIEFMIRSKDGKPLSFDYVRRLNENAFDVPPTDRALHLVAELYVATYGTQGLVDLVWDAEKQQHKYRDLAGQWVWY